MNKLRVSSDFEQGRTQPICSFERASRANSQLSPYDLTGQAHLPTLGFATRTQGNYTRYMKMVGTFRAGLLLVSPFIVCTGCWEEVHYTPSKQTASPAAFDDAREDMAQEDPSSDDTLIDSFVDGQARDTPEISVDDLFATPAESADSNGEAQLTTESADSAANVPDAADHASGVDMSHSPAAAQAPPNDIFGSDDTTAEVENSPISGDPAAGSSAMPPTELMRPSRTAFAVWRMSSRWSMAAAIYAKEQPADRYRDFLDQAAYAADIVGVDLPPMPVSDGMSLEVAVIGYLLDSNSNLIVQSLGEDYEPAYAALAELAIRTNALLLVYTPKSRHLDSLIASIRQSAENSHLPPELWLELIAMLERRESFADVKQRVLAFHTEVSDYLAGEE